MKSWFLAAAPLPPSFARRIKHAGVGMRTISLISDVMGAMTRVPGAKMGKVPAKLDAIIEEWPSDYHTSDSFNGIGF